MKAGISALAAAMMQLCATAGFAQTVPVPVPVPVPGAIAEARAAADRIILEAGAGAYFTNVTTANVPTVRHERSGLECMFEHPGASRITIFPPSPVKDLGDDVSCNAPVGPGAVVTHTLYATRYKVDGLTSERELQAAVNAIVARWPDAKPYTGMRTDNQISDRGGKPAHPPIRSAWYQVTADGEALFTKASTVVIGSWVFKQRTTAPLADATMAEFDSAPTFTYVAMRAAANQAGH